MIEGQYQGFEVVVHEPGIVASSCSTPLLERLNVMGAGADADLSEVLLAAQLDDHVSWPLC